MCKLRLVHANQLLAFASCNNLWVRNIHLKDSPDKHMTLFRCSQVHVDSVSVTAPADSPNTDGINMGNSDHVYISSCSFQTGKVLSLCTCRLFYVYSQITVYMQITVYILSCSVDQSIYSQIPIDPSVFSALVSNLVICGPHCAQYLAGLVMAFCQFSYSYKWKNRFVWVWAFVGFAENYRLEKDKLQLQLKRNYSMVRIKFAVAIAGRKFQLQLL